MLTLQDVLRESQLGLQRIGVSDADPEISWAHVSELPDPSPWLSGRELLLTTGLELFRVPGQSHDFVRQLVDRGVSALGLSTGLTLPHAEVPGELVEAAQELSFPLVHVPERTPLQAVIRFVSDALNLEETEPLRRALIAQRKLGEAAARKDGLTAVLATLGDGTGISAVVHDQSLRRLAQVGDQAAEEFARNEPRIRDRILRGNQWSLADESADGTTLAYPIGTGGQTRGVFLCSKRGPMNFFDRTLVSMVLSLLGVLLELRHSGAVHRRMVGERVADALLEGHLTDVEAALKLASIGVESADVQVLALPGQTNDDLADSLISLMEQHCAAVLPLRRDDRLLVLLCEPGDQAEEAVSRLVELRAIGPAGLGMKVDPARAALSLTQAVRAQALARAKGRQISILSASQGYRTLLALAGSVERAAFADAVLAPIDAHDARYGTRLGETLRVYLTHTLNLENAARELEVHRHTMRSRLDRISSLTGRRFTDPADLFELWLACETRLLSV